MTDWGFIERFYEISNRDEGAGIGARVVADYGEMFRVAIAFEGETVEVVEAHPSGKLRRWQTDPEHWPHVGDFVMCDGPRDFVRITQVLPRRTVLMRKNPGERVVSQVLAANIDIVLILMSMHQPINRGRLERSLVLAWDSGAEPVVVLTKSDLCADPDSYRRAAEAVSHTVRCLPVSAMTGDGMGAVQSLLGPAKTIALMGPSGVGKSTLVNHWLGDSRQRVMAVRRGDDRGRHTTTHRELFRLANGAMVIDIPGIREVGLWEGDIDRTFDDVASLAATCHFTNCRHQGEPGCQVTQAVQEGFLSQDRLHQYQKLQRELQYVGRQRSHRAWSDARKVWKRQSQEGEARRREKTGGDSRR